MIYYNFSEFDSNDIITWSSFLSSMRKYCNALRVVRASNCTCALLFCEKHVFQVFGLYNMF